MTKFTKTGIVNCGNFEESDTNKVSIMKNETILADNFDEEMVDNSKLKLHFKLNSNDGETVYDCSGNCNNGTITGTYYLTDDTPRNDKSQIFDGNTYITVNNTSSLKPYTNTVCVWVKPKALAKSQTIIDCNGFSLNINASGEVEYKHMFSTSSYTVTSTSSLEPDGWSFITATYDDKDVKLYINGILEKTVTYNHTIAFQNNYFWKIACDINNDSIFSGQMSDIKVYSIALNESIIKRIYDVPVAIGKNKTLYGYEMVEK